MFRIWYGVYFVGTFVVYLDVEFLGWTINGVWACLVPSWVQPIFEYLVLVLIHAYGLVCTNRAVEICTDCMGVCVIVTQRIWANISLLLTSYFQETKRCSWRQKTIFSRCAIQFEVLCSKPVF